MNLIKSKRILVQAALLLLLAQAAQSQPKIRILPSTILELGDLYTGMRVERIAVIKNDGTDTLRISEIKPSCGCTSALLQNDRRDLGPSDTVRLTLTFDTQNNPGKIIKSVDVYSNDSTNSVVSILFSAFVIDRLDLNPPRVNFYIHRVDSVYREIVRVKNQGKDRTLKFLSTETKLENLKVKLGKDTLRPGEETQLELSYRPAKAENAAGIIELKSSDPLLPSFLIPVHTWVR